MKKIITIAAIFLGLGSTAHAQDNDADNREKLQIGGKFGLSHSNVYDDDGDEFNADPKQGFAGGVFIAIPLGKYFGIQPEALLTQKGFKGSGSLLGSQYEFKRTTTFLDIPILFALKPSEFITVLVGPQYSYLLKQRDEFTSSAASFLQEKEFDQDNIRKNILGITGGVDINLKHIVIGGRAGWDVQNNKGNGTSSTPRYKNVSIQLTVGYKLY